ncbi:MAG: hypothetical protein M1822_006233 [Bathelium mastoideum]|nr:MAG: hypothetical protein M1822_006233 [Bathelium mastoideum]
MRLAVAYVDLWKHEEKSSQETQSGVLQSIIHQLLAQSRHPEDLLYGLFNSSLADHAVSDFWQLFDPSKGQCHLSYLAKALGYVTSELGKTTLILIILENLQKAINIVRKSLLGLLTSNESLRFQAKILICTSREMDMLDIPTSSLTFRTEDEIQSCVNSLKFQEWEKRRSAVEQPLEGSNEWIWTNPTFVEWRDSASILWIKGKPGSGKSTIARMIADKLAAHSEPQRETNTELKSDQGQATVVAGFFYSARLGVKGMGHDWMLRSILYQVLARDHLFYRHYQSAYRRLVGQQYGGSFWDFAQFFRRFKGGLDQEAPDLAYYKKIQISLSLEDLTGVFENIAADRSTDRAAIYCILDGFDESVEGAIDVLWRHEYTSMRKKTLLWLTGLAARKNAVPWLKIIVLSRPTTDITLALSGFHSITVEEHNQAAIERITDSYLTSIGKTMHKWQRLDSRHVPDRSGSDFQSWQHNPEPILDTLRSIRERVLKSANGTILWVVLVLKELRYQLEGKGVYTLEDVDRALDSLPEGIEELYKELIARLCLGRSQNELRRARDMLVWACFAQRPLTLLEFCDAIAATGWTTSDTSSFEAHFRRNRVQLFDPDSLQPIERDIVNSCGCLLEVVKGQNADALQSYVQVTHQTVLDFVLRQDCAAKPFDLSYSEAHSRISSTIHDYLTFCTQTPIEFPKMFREGSFQDMVIRPLWKHCEQKPFLTYAMQYLNPSNTQAFRTHVMQSLNMPKPQAFRQEDRATPSQAQELLATMPSVPFLDPTQGDVDIFLNAMIVQMGQAFDRWKRSRQDIWSFGINVRSIWTTYPPQVLLARPYCQKFKFH